MLPDLEIALTSTTPGPAPQALLAKPRAAGKDSSDPA